MDTEDLLRLRDWLQDVAAMPGWERLMALLDAESARAERVSSHVERWQPRGLDALIQHQAMEGHTVGYMKGLAAIRRVVERVQTTARAVEAAQDMS
jgi:hypothetical protein